MVRVLSQYENIDVVTYNRIEQLDKSSQGVNYIEWPTKYVNFANFPQF